MTMITERIRDHALGEFRRTWMRPSAVQAARIADSIVTSVLVWLERARQRRELLGLSDRELHDFGVSRCDAAGEGSKPFWRP
jgi:uncharacterized protein YjiS (DUF1127 family)